MTSFIGALRVVMGLDSTTYESGLKRVRAQTRATETSLQASFKKMSMAAQGFIALAIGSAFGQYARSALQYAAGLGEVARQTGVTVEQYQILSRAARAAGIEQTQLDSALQRLQITLGEAKAGSERAIKAFKNLGITEEQLRSMNQAGDVLPKVMEGYKQLGASAVAAAASKELMGRSVAKLAPILEQGASGYALMAQRAREAGLLTEDQANKADVAMDALDDMAITLKTKLGIALTDNVEEVKELTDNIVSLVDNVLWAVGELKKLKVGIANLEHQGNSFLMQALGYFQGPGGTRPFAAMAQKVVAGNNAAIARNNASLKPSPAPSSRRRNSGGGGGDHDFLASGSGSKATNAERTRDEEIRQQAQHEREITLLKVDELRLQQDLTEDYSERATLAIRILDLEKASEFAQIAFQQKLGELDGEKAKELILAIERNDALKRDKIRQEEQERREKEYAELAEGDLRRQREALEAQAYLATTAKERRRIELKILDLAYQEERLRLQAIINGKDAHAAEQARRDLANLDKTVAADRQGVIESTMGPLEALGAQIPRTADQINEAFEGISARGIQSLTDGLAEAISGARSLGQVFKQVANQIIADLVRIAFQRAIMDGLANILGSIGGGGWGNGWSAGNDGVLFGHNPTGGAIGMHTGGSFRVAGQAGVDNNLVSMRLSQGEVVDVRRPNALQSGERVIKFDLRGAVVTEDLPKQMQKMADGAAMHGAVGGAALARLQIARSSKRRLV